MLKKPSLKHQNLAKWLSYYANRDPKESVTAGDMVKILQLIQESLKNRGSSDGDNAALYIAQKAMRCGGGYGYR